MVSYSSQVVSYFSTRGFCYLQANKVGWGGGGYFSRKEPAICHFSETWSCEWGLQVHHANEKPHWQERGGYLICLHVSGLGFPACYYP